MQLITASQAGPVEVSTGESFTILLDEIPTSGYIWQFESLDSNIQLTGNKYYPAEHSAIGGGGKRSFIFHIAQPGNYTIKMSLVQPWTGPASAVQQHSFIIDAK